MAKKCRWCRNILSDSLECFAGTKNMDNEKVIQDQIKRGRIYDIFDIELQ